MHRVFYSFHYASDVMRVWQIRNMKIFEDDKPAQPNKWEGVRRETHEAIKDWIDKTMASCSCVCVLIGKCTNERYWVRYEIEHAWNTNKGLMGIAIHDLNPVNEKLTIYGEPGENPFKNFYLTSNSSNKTESQLLSSVIPIRIPNPRSAYHDIETHLSDWIEDALLTRELYPNTHIKSIK